MQTCMNMRACVRAFLRSCVCACVRVRAWARVWARTRRCVSQLLLSVQVSVPLYLQVHASMYVPIPTHCPDMTALHLNAVMPIRFPEDYIDIVEECWCYGAV